MDRAAPPLPRARPEREWTTPHHSSPRASSAGNDAAGPGRSSSMPMTPAELLALASKRRAEATQAWSDLLGGGAACRIDGSLSSHEGAKLREGETASLGLVVRQVRANPDADAVASLEAAAEKWARTPVPGRGRDWDAYRRGGDGAIADLRAAVESAER